MGKYTDDSKVRNLFPKIDEMEDISDTQVIFFIDQAEPIIDGKIATRYTLPFSLVPPLIESIATEFALIKVLDRFFTQETQSENEWRSVRKEELDRLLDGIADGTVTLVNSAGEIIEQRTDLTGLVSTTESTQPVFDLDDITRSVIDPDLIEDLRNEKDSKFR